MNKIIVTVSLVFAFCLLSAANVQAASCRPIAGTPYYSDGVARFSDAKCQKEIVGNAGIVTGSVAFAEGGTANCRYNAARQQYSDGTAFFTDNRCQREALNGETVAAVAGASTVALAPSGTVSSAQYAQLSQRIDALEKRLVSLQSIMAQILALLKK
ncbi:MAG: hypothetical protein MUD10_03385 [Candidatus Pacebacteria bacterium]|jgi:hypothetical protein|nr:hypothetical protein [Candidatus Paceibacterota bacterium]